MDRFAFGNSPEMADRLLELVLAGKKTATTSSVSDPTAAQSHAGRQSIILDGQGRERAIIETTEVAVRRFDEVDTEYARLEGEGDLSFEYWRKEHERFFRQEGTYSPDMKVICEKFKLVRIL